MPAQRRRSTGFTDRAARVIQAAYRARRGSVVPFGSSQPRSALAPYSRGALNLATGVAGVVTGLRYGSKKRKLEQGSLKGAVLSAGVGGSKSYFTLKNSKLALSPMDKMISPQFLARNYGFRTTSLIGKQNSVVLGSYYTPANIVAELNGVVSAAAPKTLKAVLCSVHADILITNQENSTCWYTIYDVIARRDGNAVVADPNTAFQAGFADATGGSASDYLIPGVTPFACPRFAEFFKIHKVTEGTMESGQTHVHTIDYRPERSISNEVATNSGLFIGGLTLWSFIIYHGAPMNDSTTKTQVSLGPMNLDVVEKAQFVTKYIAQGYQTTTFANSLPLAFTNVADIMNEFTGTAQNDQAA